MLDGMISVLCSPPRSNTDIHVAVQPHDRSQKTKIKKSKNIFLYISMYGFVFDVYAHECSFLSLKTYKLISSVYMPGYGAPGVLKLSNFTP